MPTHHCTICSRCKKPCPLCSTCQCDMLRAVDAAMTNVRSEGLIVRVENKISTLAKERDEAANNGKADMFKVLIQRDSKTARFHPAYYRFYPFPGGVSSPTRYKSVGHHTLGFESYLDAHTNAIELANKLGVSIDQGFKVREVEEAGPDILLEQ